MQSGSWAPFITVIFSLNILLGVKTIRLIDKADLFKISNLVLGRKEIVTSLYSNTFLCPYLAFFVYYLLFVPTNANI